MIYSQRTSPHQTIEIILVHGTFAPDSPWTLEQSRLREAISQSTTQKVNFTRFNWNGQNSHDARRESSLALTRLVQSRMMKHPQATHWIIAHSHGGNIAKTAMQRQDFPEGLAGTICLATPFFRAESRPTLQNVAFIIKALSLLFLGSTLIFYLLIFLHPNFPNRNTWGMPMSSRDLSAHIVIAASSAVFILMDRFVLPKLYKKISRLSDHLIRGINDASRIRNPIYFINSHKDEIIIAFRIAHRLTSISKSMLRLRYILAAFLVYLAWLMPSGNQAIFRIGAVLGDNIQAITIFYTYPAIITLDFLFPISILKPLTVPVAALFALVSIGIFSFIGLTASIILQYIAIIFQMGWSWRWKLGSTIIVDINVSTMPQPPISGQVEMFDVKRKMLAHSNITNDDKVIKRITQIIVGSNDRKVD